jgi:hypothetical protein
LFSSTNTSEKPQRRTVERLFRFISRPCSPSQGRARKTHSCPAPTCRWRPIDRSRLPAGRRLGQCGLCNSVQRMPRARPRWELCSAAPASAAPAKRTVYATSARARINNNCERAFDTIRTVVAQVLKHVLLGLVFTEWSPQCVIPELKRLVRRPCANGRGGGACHCCRGRSAATCQSRCIGGYRRSDCWWHARA